jgi:hypothetical protein
MARAAAVREHNALTNDNAPLDRDALLARYRQLREISIRHHRQILESISTDALLHQASRLGLARGKTLLLEEMEDMSYACDLAIHTAPAGRSRAIDRYARSAGFAGGSDEALVLEAMRAARFSILVIERRHETAGLVAIDLFRRNAIWLVDVGLESSMPDGGLIATRLFTPEGFSMAAGAGVQFDDGLIEDICALLPRHLRQRKPAAAIEDRRFAESIYRMALADASMDRLTYRELPDEA